MSPDFLETSLYLEKYNRVGSNIDFSACMSIVTRTCVVLRGFEVDNTDKCNVLHHWLSEHIVGNFSPLVLNAYPCPWKSCKYSALVTDFATASVDLVRHALECEFFNINTYPCIAEGFRRRWHALNILDEKFLSGVQNSLTFTQAFEYDPSRSQQPKHE